MSSGKQQPKNLELQENNNLGPKKSKSPELWKIRKTGMHESNNSDIPKNNSRGSKNLETQESKYV